MVAQIKAQGLLFDLDGTLISSIAITEQIYTHHSNKHNVDAQKVLDFCHGVPTLQVLQKLFPPETHTAEYAAQLEQECAEQLDGIEEIEGALKLTRQLPLDAWAVFTSGMPFLALPRMEFLKMPIPRVFITPVDVAQGKPMPDGYLLAAKRLQRDISQCVVFEDAAAGIKAGRDAGAVVVGVRTHLGAAQLIAAGASYTVKNMTKVAVTQTPEDPNTLLVSIDEE
ncbi:hypothetical protein LPJ78_004092 [Coemansia sp. RSA 989]|nr:hypothetical protein LPJ79_003811 [Coemansia sp. RSA 1821]KAJ1863359.1 hypothetical protein LPJ78_004092 [Coemansia sp. RSA 989]KAJ1870402.1 hypothetical protein LPJ55_004684 [Coemansia sp. RSA 990]KAJ2668608.1 hypothetical protein IWW42_005077 [Coemansia sp. RSA 1085]